MRDRHADMETDRQTCGQTDRQTDIHYLVRRRPVDNRPNELPVGSSDLELALGACWTTAPVSPPGGGVRIGTGPAGPGRCP